MYGPHRVLELSERPVSFGASEMIADGMKAGLVDAAVVVCEGAGTVVAARPEVVAALGAHMTGLVRTEPIEEIQSGLRERGCILLDDRCTIDQSKGTNGPLPPLRKIVVTITGKRAFDAADQKAGFSFGGRGAGDICGPQPRRDRRSGGSPGRNLRRRLELRLAGGP